MQAPSATTIDKVWTSAYRIPTEGLEADGTFEWNSTTLVVVRVSAGDRTGIGYTYGSPAACQLIADPLAQRVRGQDALGVERIWNALVGEVRNVGRPGIASHAISAIDAALWDLKAKLLEQPLCTLLGSVRDAIRVYGSGGFTSYGHDELVRHLKQFADQGITAVKMKVGAQPACDVERVAAAREAIGPDVELMVDANGAYDRKQALAKAEAFAQCGVSWFEEPVSSDDLEGLRLLRDRAPGGMQVAAGEYGYDPFYFRRMLQAGAVDVLQADATRCLGITGFLAAAHLAQTFFVPLSAHTAPSIHAHVCCAATAVRHLEYFYDHVRIESRLFDGFVPARHGAITPDRTRPGLGIELKDTDAARYAL